MAGLLDTTDYKALADPTADYPDPSAVPIPAAIALAPADDGGGDGGSDLVSRIGRAIAGGPAGITDLSQAQSSAAGRHALLNFGLGVLQAAGPSYTPRSGGQILASGIGAASDTETQAESTAAQQKQLANELGLKQAELGLKGEDRALKLAQWRYQMQILQRQAAVTDSIMRALTGQPAAPGAGGGGPGAAKGAPVTPYVGANLPSGVTPDEDQLVRTVYGEAGGEPVAGQQAVAHVIKTRMGLAGQGVQDTVFAPNQFEAWADPKNRPRMEALDPASPQYQAILNNVVRPVMTGQAADPTGGATHFYNPTLQTQLGRGTPGFAQGNRTSIGNHQFFYGGYGPQAAAPAPAPYRVATASGQVPPPPSSPAGTGTTAVGPAAGAPTAPQGGGAGVGGGAVTGAGGGPPSAAPGAADGPGYVPSSGARTTILPGAPPGAGTTAPGTPEVGLASLPFGQRQLFAAQLAAAQGKPEETAKVLADINAAVIDWSKRAQKEIVPQAEARQLFGAAYDPTAIYMRNKTDGSVEVVQQGQHPVNIADTPDAKAAAVSMAIAQKRLDAMGTTAQGATRIRSQLEMLTALLPKLGGADVLAKEYPNMLNLMQTFGVGTPAEREQMSAQQAFQGIVSQLSVNMRDTGTGRLSNQEMDQFTKALPNIGQDPKSRALILGFLSTMANRQIRENDYANNYFMTNHHLAGLDDQMEKDLGPSIPHAPGYDATPQDHVKFQRSLRPGQPYYKPNGSLAMNPTAGG